MYPLRKLLLHEKKNFQQCIRGVFAVEVALLAPIVLMLCVAVYDFSIVIHNKMAVQNAAKIGAQYGLIRRPVQGDFQPIIDAVNNTLLPGLSAPADHSSVSVDPKLVCECSVSGAVSCTASCGAGEQKLTYLSVTVSVNHPMILQYPAIDPVITLSDESLVRLQ